MDKEACKREGAWLHWFGCHTHRSKTYGPPCIILSMWIVDSPLFFHHIVMKCQTFLIFIPNFPRWTQSLSKTSKHRQIPHSCFLINHSDQLNISPSLMRNSTFFVTLYKKESGSIDQDRYIS